MSPRMVELARERGLDARVADVAAVAVRRRRVRLRRRRPGCSTTCPTATARSPSSRVCCGPAAASSPRRLAEDNFAESGSFSASWSATSPSTGERGEQLEPYFARVERRDCDGTVVFPTRRRRRFVAASMTRAHLAGNVPELRAVRARAPTRSSSRRRRVSLDDPRSSAPSTHRARARARMAVYRWADGPDAPELASTAVAEARPAVLEVGCGTGDLTERIAAELGAEVVALDQSERMVELTRERGVDARVADVAGAAVRGRRVRLRARRLDALPRARRRSCARRARARAAARRPARRRHELDDHLASCGSWSARHRPADRSARENGEELLRRTSPRRAPGRVRLDRLSRPTRREAYVDVDRAPAPGALARRIRGAVRVAPRSRRLRRTER